MTDARRGYVEAAGARLECASITLIFAAAASPARDGLLGLCLEAPHAFVADCVPFAARSALWDSRT